MNPIAKTTSFLVACALGAAATSALADEAGADSAKAVSKGEIELAEMLEGRVAGEPESCIREHQSRNMRIIDGTAIVYGRGKTIWVNRTRHPEALDDADLLVVRKWSTDLCKLDHVTSVDRFSGMFSGAVFLSVFVPYTKVEPRKGDEG